MGASSRLPAERAVSGYYLDIDSEGDVLGAEFLSLEEFTEWASQKGLEVKLPDHIEDPNAYRLNLA